MNKLVCLLLPPALFLASCAHHAAHFTAPDASRLQAAGHRLASAVAQSNASVATASAAVKASSASHAAEKATAEALAPKLEDLFKVAPPELRPQIQALQADVATLRADQEQTEKQLTQAQASQAEATSQLEQANAAKNEVEKLSPGYLAEVDHLTARANTAEAAWAKDSAKLKWYILHFWLSWIILAAGILACGLLAFLKFTGRLTLSAASIAAKV